VLVAVVAEAVVVVGSLEEVESVVVVVELTEDEPEEEEVLPPPLLRQLVEVPCSITVGALKAVFPILSVTLRVMLVPAVILTVQVIESSLVGAN